MQIHSSRSSPVPFATSVSSFVHVGRFRYVLLLLLLLLSTCASIEAQLAPLGTPIPPAGTSQVEQMAFDPVKQSLYLAMYARHVVVEVCQVSTAALLPTDAAPWTYAVLTGKDGINGEPGLSELPPHVAMLNGPIGVVG